MYMKENHSEKLGFKVLNSWTYFWLIISCFGIEIYWVWYIVNEIRELIREKLQYLMDIWNYLDFAIIAGTQLFLFQFLCDMLSGT